MLIGALVILIGASCDGGTTVQAVPDWGGGPSSPYVPKDYELVFEDNFDALPKVNGSASLVAHRAEGRIWVDHFKGWGVRYLEGNNDQALKADASYRGQGGKSLGEHGIRLRELTDRGTLRLFGMPTPPDLEAQFEMPYLGGMISGERLHAQTYGYWEVRLRFKQLSAGQHWALWLIPIDHSWPPEIDMIEVVGSNPDNQSDAEHFFFNSIAADPNNDHYTQILPPRGHDAWYTIGFLWTEQDMRWYLDGEEVRHRPALATDQELYFLMSPEIGGEWVGAPTAETVWPMEAEIDYIRIYRSRG
jgi:hypothetical protein